MFRYVSFVFLFFSYSAIAQKIINFSVDPYLLSPSSTSMTVMFEINKSSDYKVAYRKLDYGEEWQYSTAKLIPDSNSIFMSKIVSLSGDTLYEYQIIDGADGLYSQIYYFKTWPDIEKNHDAKFIAVADTQLSLVLKDMIENAVMQFDCDKASPKTCAENIKGIILGGDIVDSSFAIQYRSILGNMKAITPYVPLIPTPGNHDYFASTSDNPDRTTWAKNYRKYFYGLPNNDSIDSSKLYYELSYLGLKFLNIDTTPMSATHGSSDWYSEDHDYGKDYFNLDYTKQQEQWYIDKINQYYNDGTKYIVSTSHYPCLTSIWREGESMAACELVSQVEQFSRKTNAITANLFGHVHSYQRGQSRDARHLWLNISTAGGAVENVKTITDRSNLDHFMISRNELGYSTLTFGFGGVPALNTKRRSIKNEDNPSAERYDVRDEITIKEENFDLVATLPNKNLGVFDMENLNQLILDYDVTDLSRVLEAEWQISRDPDFENETFIVWGNETRASNLFFDDNSNKPIDTQQGKDQTTYNLGNNSIDPPYLWPIRKDDGWLMRKPITTSVEDWDMWGCERKLDYGANGEGRNRQCTHELTNGINVMTESPPELSFAENQTWYYRVKLRDQFLNWGKWSRVGYFRIGPMDYVNPEPDDSPYSIIPDSNLDSGVDLGTLNPPDHNPIILDAKASPGCLLKNVQIGNFNSDLPANKKSLEKGLLSLDVNCESIMSNGFSAEIILTFDHDIPKETEIWWYNRGTLQWTKLESNYLSENSISYKITDGGLGDESGKIDSVIQDPIALLLPSSEPNPPMAIPSTGLWALLVFISSILFTLTVIYRKKYFISTGELSKY